MDANHAISVAVKQARAVAVSAPSVTIVHPCPRCVVPRIVVGHVLALLSVSQPGSPNRPGIMRWLRHACSFARYSRTSRTRSRPDHNRPKRSLFWA